jgi:hypothetical protein
MSTKLTPWQKVARQQNRIIFWALFHIVCLICLAAGLYYTVQFMRHPDRVLIQDQSGSLYRGHTGPVICREVAEDTARRATFAFLDRSYRHDNRAICEAIFGKLAQKSLFELINRSKDEFAEQKIRQMPEITRITVRDAAEDRQCLVWVEGILYRTGIYMEMPYFQKLEYLLGLRLMQSDDAEQFPLRVLRMTYQERSVYDSKKKGPSK